MIRFLVKVFIVASVMLLSRANETTSKVSIISIMLYNPDIAHSLDNLFLPNETAFDCTKNRKLFYASKNGGIFVF